MFSLFPDCSRTCTNGIDATLITATQNVYFRTSWFFTLRFTQRHSRQATKKLVLLFFQETKQRGEFNTLFRQDFKDLLTFAFVNHSVRSKYIILLYHLCMGLFRLQIKWIFASRKPFFVAVGPTYINAHDSIIMRGSL